MRLLHSSTRSGSTAGFTILEALVVLVILAIIAALGVPALMTSLRQSKLEGIARQVASLTQRARLEAIKRNRQTMVTANTASGEIVVFVDANENRSFDASEEVVTRLGMPALVTLTGTTAGAAEDALPIEGFGGASGPVFLPNGAVEAQGAIRLADARDNVLEVRIVSEATGRVEVRKWLDSTMDLSATDLRAGATGTPDGWYAKGDAGRGWVWN